MATEQFTNLERSVMEMLLAGEHPALDVLREQFALSSLARREQTGVGFFLHFDVPSSVPRLSVGKRVDIGDVGATLEGVQHGAGFVLFVDSGVISMLEGYTYDEPWPSNAQAVELKYLNLPRDLGKLPSNRR